MEKTFVILNVYYAECITFEAKTTNEWRPKGPLIIFDFKKSYKFK